MSKGKGKGMTCSKECHSVRMARFKHDVYAMSNLKLLSCNNLPAAAGDICGVMSQHGRCYHEKVITMQQTSQQERKDVR